MTFFDFTCICYYFIYLFICILSFFMCLGLVLEESEATTVDSTIYLISLSIVELHENTHTVETIHG